MSKFTWDDVQANESEEKRNITRMNTKGISTAEQKPNEDWINPWVYFKLRLSTVNRLNELWSRDQAKAILKDGYDEWDETERKYACPTCHGRVHDDEPFCKHCGQKLDLQHYGL